ncbi:interleukin 17-like protein [Diadema antillarum]|uniref:interleukin 17-like protein n=1 Tax=Diadema antillarum TaxID=105358 RepID=UPI003A878425
MNTLHLFTSVIAAIFQTIASSPVPVTAQTCLPIDAADSHRRNLNSNLFYPKAAAFAVQSFNVSTSDMGLADTSSCPFDGFSSSPDCPVGVKADPGSPEIVNQDGSCPWTYVECFDADRIPMAITMAQCQCSACLDPYTHEADPNLRCQPVMYNMKVLQKTQCVDGHFRYEQRTLQVPVSCACMRMRRD